MFRLVDFVWLVFRFSPRNTITIFSKDLRGKLIIFSTLKKKSFASLLTGFCNLCRDLKVGRTLAAVSDM